MAILRVLNEFILESVVLALEPARACASSCSYCFATLNSRYQLKGQSKNLEDLGTFERTLEKAYSPVYNPEDFVQWALRNRLTLGYANTVEPFQDLIQARNILKICNSFSIPLFIQTKGYNFFDICDDLLPLRDNVCMFISLPCLDDRVIKRFEPRTPKAAERLKVLDWLVEHEFFTIVALSPYLENWCDEPAGLVDELASHGVDEIFFDRLHLNNRQLSQSFDPYITQHSNTRSNPFPDKAFEHLKEIYWTAMENGLEFYANSFYGTICGLINTLPTISPASCYKRGLAFPYNDGMVFHFLEHMFYSYKDGEAEIDMGNRDYNDSIVVRWADALFLMEADGAIQQRFAYSSLRDLIQIEKKIPDIYKTTYLKPSAPMSSYFRAIWNNPHRNSFVFRHPWIRIAMKPDNTPWTDEQGNTIYLFDPDYTRDLTSKKRTVESLEPFRSLTFDKAEDEDEIHSNPVG